MESQRNLAPRLTAVAGRASLGQTPGRQSQIACADLIPLQINRMKRRFAVRQAAAKLRQFGSRSELEIKHEFD